MNNEINKISDYELDQLHNTFDWLFQLGLFSVADDLMVHLTDVTNDTDMFLGMLTATFPAKSKLPNRNYLYLTAKGFLKEKHPEEWEELLKGLE